MVQGLSDQTQPNPGFREAARATLRLSRARGRAECDALADLFEQSEPDDARRLLILDLLANAGTPDAQATMRRLLLLPSTRRNSRLFSRFVQRLGFVERPDGETLAFMTDLYIQARGASSEVRTACAYALGASIGRGHVWDLTEDAQRAADVLRADLLTAASPADKCGLIAALGHAALEDDVGLLLRFVVDVDAQVRATAVLALRKLHTTEARVWLLSAVGGADHELAESALSALFEHSLDPEELVRLAELVLAGRTVKALDARILRLLGRHKATSVDRLEHEGAIHLIQDAVKLLMNRIEMPAPHPSERRGERASTPPARMALSDESGEYARYANSQRPPMSTTPFPRSIFPSAIPADAVNAKLPSIPPLAPISEVSVVSGVRPSRPPARTFRSAAEALQSCVKKSSRPPQPPLPTETGEHEVESAASEIRPAAAPLESSESIQAFSRPVIPIAKIS